MRTRRVIFAPIFGPQPVEDWTTVPHIKVWGLWDENENQLEVIHMENAGAASIYVPTGLFESEIDHVRDIDGDMTVPDEVAQRLAVRALMPDELGEAN